MGENYDATWYEYKYGSYQYGGVPIYGADVASSYILTTSSNTLPSKKSPTKEELAKYLQTISNLPPIPPKQEAPVKTEQQEIDDAAREAIAKPRREAEIKKRVAAIEKLGTDDSEYEDGTVLSWERKYGTKTYSYAAIKAGGKWYVTGTANGAVGNGWTYEALVEWMTTGENLVTNVRVATAWKTILK